MTNSRHLPTRTTTIIVLSGLIAVSCGSSNGDNATSATKASDPTTTTESLTTQPTPEATTTTAAAAPATDPRATDSPATTAVTLDPDCPAAPVVPPIASVDAEAQPLPAEEEAVPLDPGRYRDERLGLGLALDIGEGFEVPLQTAGAITFFAQEGVFNLLRPAGFITDVPERGEDPELIELESWLASGLVTVESETARTIAGYPARDIVLAVPSDSDITPLTMAWGLTPNPAVRMIVVDLGDDEPFVALSEATAPGDVAFGEVTDQIVNSLVIGDVGPSPETTFSDTPWDAGNLDFPVDVSACPVPLVGFGGSEFELAAPARIFGQGDEIWIVAPDEPWEGTGPPYIQLVGPATATSLQDFSRRNGEPIDTTDDAITALEAAGYLLTPADTDATLLGAAVTAFDFEGPDEPVAPWLARSHAVSVGDTNVSDPPFRDGLIYIAETEVGVVVARVDGERDTNDVDLLRERFDTLVETLEFR